MAHWSVPMTYKPKADAVFAGTCRQTIRRGNKYQPGDTLTIFEWSGKPRRSKWGRRLKARVTEARLLWIDDTGAASSIGEMVTYGWGSSYLSELAAKDGIVPPTGEALRDTLRALNGGEGWEGWYQVVRWEVI